MNGNTQDLPLEIEQGHLDGRLGIEFSREDPIHTIQGS